MVERSRGTVGRQGQYDEVQSLIDRAKEVVQEMAKTTEDAIIQKVQEQQKQQSQNEEKSQKRIVNPMQDQEDGVDGYFEADDAF